MSEERNERLREWLSKHNAIHLWHQAFRLTGKGTRQITAYTVNGHLILIHESASGWEIFVPVSDSIEMAATFAATEKRLGLISGSDIGDRPERLTHIKETLATAVEFLTNGTPIHAGSDLHHEIVVANDAAKPL